MPVNDSCRLQGDESDRANPSWQLSWFQMELSFDSFRHDFDITLKGAVSHRVSLGTDARGNIIRLDNALSSIPEKLEKAHEQLTNLQISRKRPERN